MSTPVTNSNTLDEPTVTTCPTLDEPTPLDDGKSYQDPSGWDLVYRNAEKYISERELLSNMARLTGQGRIDKKWYRGVQCLIRGSVQLLVQVARGPRHSNIDAPPHPVVIVQQISTRPSEQGRGLATEVLRKLAAATAAFMGPTARVMVQAVQNPRLMAMLLGPLGGAVAPGSEAHSFGPDIFLPAPAAAAAARRSARLRLLCEHGRERAKCKDCVLA